MRFNTQLVAKYCWTKILLLLLNTKFILEILEVMRVFRLIPHRAYRKAKAAYRHIAHMAHIFYREKFE